MVSRCTPPSILTTTPTLSIAAALLRWRGLLIVFLEVFRSFADSHGQLLAN
jgi:hypothetical protein